MACVGKHVGVDRYMVNKHVRELGQELIESLEKWETGARALWADWELVGYDEFFQSRSGNLKRIIGNVIFQE